MITGGARSGKSSAAEARLAGFPNVRYLATSAHDGTDPEWSARVQAHRTRRPVSWSTVETTDLVGQIELAAPDKPVLIDCLTVWLARRLDELNVWHSADPGSLLDSDSDSVPEPVPELGSRSAPELGSWSEPTPQPTFESTARQVPVPASPNVEPGLMPALIGQEISELVNAIEACRGILVIVTNEVGSGIVPATVSGRQFRDLMGVCNASVARACDEVILLVAGCELVVKRPG